MDQMVKETQQWLNKTYGKHSGWIGLSEDGLTGWGTMGGLTRALQCELGISTLSSNFGPATTSSFQSKVGRIDETGAGSANLLRILSGALWCKGYYGVSFNGNISFRNLSASVAKVRSDLGLSGSYVDVKLMSSLLTMDAYVIPIGSKGTESIRQVQQWLNGTYSQRKNFALIPCDGIASRGVIEGMLYAIQFEIGMDDDTANGYFGPGTKSGLKALGVVYRGMVDAEKRFVHLCQASLRINGYNAPFNGSCDEMTDFAIRGFQSFMGLDADGVCGYGTWCSLLVSCGDDTRETKGFDTSTQLSLQQYRDARTRGYTHVGRYTVGSGKFITADELQALKETGMLLLPIHQRFNNSIDEMTVAKGHEHGLEAVERARILGLPHGSTIFFCCDFDPTEDDVAGPVMDYFKAVHKTVFSIPNWTFDVGVYGTRNVCRSVIEAGYASTAFVAGMSWGWSGNMGFPMPTMWSYNQIAGDNPMLGGRKVEIDKVDVAANARAVNLVNVNTPPKKQAGQADSGTGFDTWFEWITKAEIECERQRIMLIEISEIILSYLRKPTYWTGSKSEVLWVPYTPEPPNEKRPAAEKALSEMSPKKPLQTTLRDVEHWAASTLGYVHNQPIDQAPDGFSLGDLGAWELDLVTCWGKYLDGANGEGLASWMQRHLGSPDDPNSFDMADAIADVDAYLVSHAMKVNPFIRLSDILRSLYKQSVTKRCRDFYHMRFASSEDNLYKVFDYYVNSSRDDLIKAGLGNALNFIFDIKRLPTAEESATIVRVFADKLQNGFGAV